MSLLEEECNIILSALFKRRPDPDDQGASFYIRFMEAATIKVLKDELKERTPEQIVEYCLHLARFKKENKELLTYLLFEANDEESYINTVRESMDEMFNAINRASYYFIRKGVRKILRETKKYIRYSKKKETEVQLLMYFCEKLKNLQPDYSRSTVLANLFDRQIALIRKRINTLHPDLQYDYGRALDELEGKSS